MTPRNIPAFSPQQVTPSSKIPTMAARHRRRTDSHTPRKNVVQNYRPGYTWNRGGRVKELRLRCLARKFLHVWKRNTFGRVLPSEARNHYRRHLLKETFGAWHDMWWVIRKEWGLGIRADLHNRYRLWNMTWKAWRSYTLEARIQTVKKSIADKHATRVLLKRVLTGWGVYIRMRRTKLALYEKAHEIYQDNMIKQAWQRWTREHELFEVRKNQEVAALEHWATQLVTKAWVAWRVRFSEIQMDYYRERQAVAHHDRVLISRCYAAWLIYIEGRMAKKQDKELAARVHRQTVLKKYVDTWRCRLHVVYQIREHQSAIEDLAWRTKCRRALVHWKFYIKLCREMAGKEEIAVQHHRTQTMKSSMKIWKSLVAQKKKQKIRLQMAYQFYYKSLLQLGWNNWMRRCEEREDLQMIIQRRDADKHYRLVLLEKSWYALKEYANRRSARKTQYVKADDHYVAETLPRYFTMWRDYVSLSVRRRHLMESAADFRRENLLAKCFYHWHTEFEQSQDDRMMERMAILHREEVNKHRLFQVWRQKTQDRLDISFKMDVAAEHHDFQMCRKVLLHWRGVIDDKNTMILHTHKAVRHWYCTVMGKILKAWKVYKDARCAKQVQKARADAHHNGALVKCTFSRWQKYHMQRMRVLVVVEAKIAEKNLILLKQALWQWRGNVIELQNERRKEELAVTHYGNTITYKILHAWHGEAALRAHKHQQTSEIVDRARSVLNTSVLRRALNTWRCARDAALLTRLKLQQAAEHYDSLVLRRAWGTWRDYVKLCHRKQLLMRQAMWSHNTRLTAKFYVRWKQSLAEHRVLQNKTNLALWHWCLNLQRKVLYAWVEYKVERRRKAARAAEAMEDYRRRLLRDGATQWLTVAADIADMRQKFAAERGAKNYYLIHQVVLRCAAHWRQWAAKRSAARGGASQTTSRPITALHHHAIPASSLVGVDSRVKKKAFPAFIPPTTCESPRREVITDEAPGELHQMRPNRKAPRKPNFLLDSLKREGLYNSEEASPLRLARNQMPSTMQTSAKIMERPLESVPRIVVHSTHSEPRTDQDESELPFSTYFESRSKFTGIETSTSHDTQDNVSENATENTAVTLADITPFTHDTMDLLSTGRTGMSIVTAPDSARSKVSGVSFKLAHDQSRNTESDNDLEPRSRPHPSFEQSREITFERSEDLNVSISVLSEVPSEISNADTNPVIGSKTFVPSPKCQTSDITLLPPEAFLFYKDGSRISADNGPSVDTANRPGPSSKPEERESSTNPETALTELTFQNPAEELVDIRRRLKQFHKCKAELKERQSIHAQLSEWVSDQVAGGISAQDDDDVHQAQDEITTLKVEMRALQDEIDHDKPSIRRLTERVKELLNTLATRT